MIAGLYPNKKERGTKNAVNFVTSNDAEEVLVAGQVLSTGSSNTWIVDSGATSSLLNMMHFKSLEKLLLVTAMSWRLLVVEQLI